MFLEDTDAFDVQFARQLVELRHDDLLQVGEIDVATLGDYLTNAIFAGSRDAGMHFGRTFSDSPLFGGDRFTSGRRFF